MSIGLLALLDDVTALIKASAVVLDDIPSQVAKTSGKVSGIVIDDAAVTPKYVVGLNPQRELAVIYKIARMSLVNKILILGPVILVLGFCAPWIIQPLLMIGGAYLCFEGYEKVHSIFSKHNHPAQKPQQADMEIITPEELEAMRVKSAVRTDFILSSEIMAITYANVTENPLINQIVVLLAVAVVITIAVYGFVGLVVKTDDMALHTARHARSAFIRKSGENIVKFMPHFLTVLGYIGTAAMLWVGAEIIAHGIPALHHGLDHLNGMITYPILAWGLKALVCAFGGVMLGFVISLLLKIVLPLRKILIHPQENK